MGNDDSTGLYPTEDASWLPQSLVDVAGRRLTEPNLQFHAGDRGGQSAIFHGQGAGKDDAEPEIEQFLRAVDDALCAHCSGDVTVVLAGVDALTSEFRRMSQYPALLDTALSGNLDDANLAELFDQAWPLVRRSHLEQRKQALEKVADYSPDARLTGLADVLKASADGRVEEIFVASDRECWGRFDPETREVTRHEAHETGDEGLLDRAARECYVRGATVHSVRARDLPDDCLAMASFRY